MTDELSELKRKVSELEARQQATQAPSKPKPGGLGAIMRLIVLILVAMVGIAALANVSGVSLTGKKTTGVSTAADVVAYQKSAAKAKLTPGETILPELRAQQASCKAGNNKFRAMGAIGGSRKIGGDIVSVEVRPGTSGAISLTPTRND